MLRFPERMLFLLLRWHEKVKNGPCNRSILILRFFMQNDSPYYNDHDFTNPEYMIVCSGYQQLVGIEGVSSSGSIDGEYLDHEKND